MTRQEVPRVAPRSYLEGLSRGCICAPSIGAMYCLLTRIRILAQKLSISPPEAISSSLVIMGYPTIVSLSLPTLSLIESHIYLDGSELNMYVKMTLRL